MLIRANHLSYLMRNPSLKDHPSPVGNGSELRHGVCRPVQYYTQPALPENLSQLPEEGQDQNNNEPILDTDSVMRRNTAQMMRILTLIDISFHGCTNCTWLCVCYIS